MEEFSETRNPTLLLEEISSLHALPRSHRRAVWFPLIAFGLVDLVGSPVTLLISRDHLGSFMFPALVTGGILSALHYRRSDSRAGAQTAIWPWIAVIAIAAFVAMVCSSEGREAGSRTLNLLGPSLAHIFGFTVLALWAQSTLMVALTGALVLVSVLCITLLSGDTAISTELLGFGLLMTGAGFFQKRRLQEAK